MRLRVSSFRSVALLAASLLLSVTFLKAQQAPIIEEGEIDGALFTVARPPKGWNGGLILHAHGYRSEEAPRVANLPVHQKAYADLLSEGWMIATTSYRRNGLILLDAMNDIDALRKHINDKYGAPQIVLLEGESMGGAIVTLLAERDVDVYAGAIAIGAALNLRESNGSGGVTLQPRIPLLFLTNQSEMEGPKSYVERATAEAKLNIALTPPVLFKVARNGHVNVNQAERLTAFRALLAWIEHGREALPKPTPANAGGIGPVYGAPEFFDATVTPPPQPSQAEFSSDLRSLTVKVTEISAIYGNVFISLQTADIAKLGVTPGSYLQLEVGDARYRVRYGRDFSSVERGQWVLFPNADGFFWLARNYANAATTAQLTVGSSVRLVRYPSTP